MKLQAFLQQGVSKGGISGVIGSLVVVLLSMGSIAFITIQNDSIDLSMTLVVTITVGVFASVLGIIPAIVVGCFCGGIIAVSSYCLRNFIDSPMAGALHGTCWGGFYIFGLWFPVFQKITDGGSLNDIAAVTMPIAIVLLSGAYTGYHTYNRV